MGDLGAFYTAQGPVAWDDNSNYWALQQMFLYLLQIVLHWIQMHQQSAPRTFAIV